MQNVKDNKCSDTSCRTRMRRQYSPYLQLEAALYRYMSLLCKMRATRALGRTAHREPRILADTAVMKQKKRAWTRCAVCDTTPRGKGEPGSS